MSFIKVTIPNANDHKSVIRRQARRIQDTRRQAALMIATRAPRSVAVLAIMRQTGCTPRAARAAYDYVRARSKARK